MSASRSLNRSLTLGLVVLVVAALSWWTWPRPAVTIQIAPGGIATVNGTILPETLYIKARGRSTVVRVVNGDSTRHQLALFGAAAGETKDFTISYPGTYGGVCSTHPSGNLVYVVQ
ncbi:MAG TPA: hypothetical protein PK788_13350 [Gemmatimonadaceae bacterium]|nr:hypothetical protein [Gemmatimonadaceae bacterium]HRQ79170.1 hypothetical protein [Gemmatimonadaceae bacterium]